MYVGNTFEPIMLWHFARKNLARTFLITLAVVLLYAVLDWTIIGVPFLPIGTIGTAVAFFVGFKNNQAYDRLWEARRLWGGITNTSRSFAALVQAVVPDKGAQADLIKRHLSYINILRLQLRKTVAWATSREHLHQTFISHEYETKAFEDGLRELMEQNNKLQFYDFLKTKANPAGLLLRHQMGVITKLKRSGQIDSFEHSDLIKHITEFYNHQGGCERIKNTPLFRQYSIFSRVFVDLFIVLLPFGLVNELGKMGSWHVWLTIPFTVLISWVFFTMEQIGEFSENPFDNAINDIPLRSICRTIEIDLLEMIGDKDVPEKTQPVNKILM